MATQAALGRDTGDPTAGDEVTAALLELYSVLFHAALTDQASGQALLRCVLPLSSAPQLVSSIRKWTSRLIIRCYTRSHL